MDKKDQKLTYLSKNKTTCPICKSNFNKENLLSGGGRLIAGNLTDELHREYKPSKKFGKIYPLIYIIEVCPNCLFASFSNDFKLVNKDNTPKIKLSSEKRFEFAGKMVGDFDFFQPRSVKEGLISYYLATCCYDYFDKSVSPAIKQAICSLRAAWIAKDLNRDNPGENYDYLTELFYHKAAFFYIEALDRAQSGEEALEQMPNLGPDIDQNYGYDGVLYLIGYLSYKYEKSENIEKRIKTLETAKRFLSKLFGSGKASKNKPAAILEKSKDLYEIINDEIKSYQPSI